MQARALLYPQLGVIGGAGVVGRDSTRDRSGAVGQVSWELDLWARVRAEGASADAARQATDADLLFARQSIVATIATLWYETIATERLRQTAADAAGASRLLGLEDLAQRFDQLVDLRLLDDQGR